MRLVFDHSNMAVRSSKTFSRSKFSLPSISLRRCTRSLIVSLSSGVVAKQPPKISSIANNSWSSVINKASSGTYLSKNDSLRTFS